TYDTVSALLFPMMPKLKKSLSLQNWYSIFFFNDTPTTEIYTLPLPDALPIYTSMEGVAGCALWLVSDLGRSWTGRGRDRKSTRPNSRHSQISYAVFCLEKKQRGGGVCLNRETGSRLGGCTPTGAAR